MQINNTNMGAVNWRQNSNNSSQNICLKQFLIPSDPIEVTSYSSNEQNSKVSTMSMDDIMLTMNCQNLATTSKDDWTEDDWVKYDILNAIDKNNNIDTSNEINWDSVGGGKLSEDNIDYLKDKYDVENMSNQDLYDLIAYLTDMNVLSKNQVSELVYPSLVNEPTFIGSWDQYGNLICGQTLEGFIQSLNHPVNNGTENTNVMQTLLDRIKYHQDGIDNIDDVKFVYTYNEKTAHLIIVDEEGNKQIEQNYKDSVLQYHKDQLEVQTELYNVLSQLVR